MWITVVPIVARVTYDANRVAKLTLAATCCISLVNNTRGATTRTLMELVLVTGVIVSQMIVAMTTELGVATIAVSAKVAKTIAVAPFSRVI
jgi:hypothetical protein